MTRYGTSHFVSELAAIRYYLPQYENNWMMSKGAVSRKLDEGEIHIGKPDLKDGETLNVIDNGTRYEITEAK